MRLGDGFHDREPEARSVPVARSLDAPGESLEDPLLLVVVDALALVPHPDADDPVLVHAADRDHLVASGVLDGVLREVHHGRGEAVRVACEERHIGPVDLPATDAESLRLGEDLVRQEVEVERLGPQEVGAGGAGQEQEIVDEAAHALQLVLDHAGCLSALRGVVPEGLEVAPDHRDRRAELVPHIGKELLLVLEGRLEAVEHSVEGASEFGDLVAAADRDAVGEVGVGDRAGCPGERAQRLDGAAGRQPDEERGEKGHDDADGDRERDGALHLVSFVREALGGDQDA